MARPLSRHRRNLRGRVVFVLALAAAVLATGGQAAHADGYQRLEGSGSTWSANAMAAWTVEAHKLDMTVDFNPNGSSAGRADFAQGTTDFAMSEVPYQFHPEDGSGSEEIARPYAYIPMVAGGTSFMYHLEVAGRHVTNLRLSPATITKIFTGVITDWSDPLITADYGAQLPSKTITPILRADGSGTSAQFTRYMSRVQPDLWHAFCVKRGLPATCGMTSSYPGFEGAKSLSGSTQVAGYISASYGDGAIGYVEYSYAKKAPGPVVKVLNPAGYFVEPTAASVAVALTQAQIEIDNHDPDVYLTQKLDGVYTDTDKRSYPLSSYSYMIIPTSETGRFNKDKGRTLGDFAAYVLCQGQQDADDLGYSPLPVNLVQAAFDQLSLIPGADPANLNVTKCANPTFNPDGSNNLADNAPYPQECDVAAQGPCTTGTAGMKDQPTDFLPSLHAGATTPAGDVPSGTNPQTGGSGGGSDAGGTGAGGGQPGASGASGTGGASTPAVLAPGSVVEGDGSVTDGKGRKLAPPGSIRAPKGSKVDKNGNITTPAGKTIQGSDAVAPRPVGGGSSRAVQGASRAPSVPSHVDAASGAVVPNNPGAGNPGTGGSDTTGGTGLVLGSDGSAATIAGAALPMAATTQIGPVRESGTTVLLFVLAAFALLGAVVVPPLLPLLMPSTKDKQ